MRNRCIYNVTVLLLWMLLHPTLGSAQGSRFAIIAYNAENLFNPQQDTLLNRDTSFTPGSLRHWGRKRLDHKTLHLARALIAASESIPLAIVGLSEVEDSVVLQKLISDTPLRRFPYRIIHRDGADPRGIDVAIIYRADLVRLLKRQWIKSPDSGKNAHPIREMLLAEFAVGEKDTLYAVQCHWPSKYGGAKESTPRRQLAITSLRKALDSVLQSNPNARILVMGDMNTTADDPILSPLIQRDAKRTKERNGMLYNAAELTARNNLKGMSQQSTPVGGTYRYKGQWQSIDLMLISSTLLPGGSGLRISADGAQAAACDFLVERDNRHGGVRPKRTYLGPAYHGGTSDHLPLRAIFEY